MHIRRMILGAVMLATVLAGVTAATAQAHPSKGAHAAMPDRLPCQQPGLAYNYNITGTNAFSLNPYTDIVNPPSWTMWQVYYDTQYDPEANDELCSMRVVLRIFPPSGQSFSGLVDVCDSLGSTLGSCYGTPGDFQTEAYAPVGGHFVGRGPWFNPTPGYQYISSTRVRYGTQEAYYQIYL